MLSFQAVTVSELVLSIKAILEEHYQEILVQGEVTNLSLSGAGHWYFNLSDENSSISCALFKADALRNPLIRNIKDGDKLIISGPISVYQKRGTFQILVKRLIPAGEGQLRLQFERLKSKLAREGLFDLDRKRFIPNFPKKIVIITAEHGAALQDFLNVIKRRSFWFDVVIVPAQVQGQDAPRSLIAGLERAQKLKDVDVIVLARGGGSLEDLWAFNDENLVRAIYACEVPVISAVGHQVDFTLSDFVADLRSETPTAAAEILSQPQTELRSRLIYCQTHIRSYLVRTQQQLQILIHKYHPREVFNLINQKIYQAEKRLALIPVLGRSKELVGIPEAILTLDDYFNRLIRAREKKWSHLSDKLLRFEHVLEALNPTKVLGRGFTYITQKDGGIISSYEKFSSLPQGCEVKIRFSNGEGNVIKTQ